jgi:hypothetical protein
LQGYTFYLIVFYILVATLFISVGICIWVGWCFKNDSFPFLWPIKVARVVVSVFVSMFYIASLNIFLIACQCNKEDGRWIHMIWGLGKHQPSANVLASAKPPEAGATLLGNPHCNKAAPCFVKHSLGMFEDLLDLATIMYRLLFLFWQLVNFVCVRRLPQTTSCHPCHLQSCQRSSVLPLGTPAGKWLQNQPLHGLHRSSQPDGACKRSQQNSTTKGRLSNGWKPGFPMGTEFAENAPFNSSSTD